MWIMLSDAFFSIVKKDCTEGQLLVRARRPGDIEKVFGRRHRVDRVEVADYLFRSVIPVDAVVAVMEAEVRRIAYGNFKASVQSRDLHDAYMDVWSAMARTQNPPPYSERRRRLPILSPDVPPDAPDIFEAEQPLAKPGQKPVTRRKAKGKGAINDRASGGRFSANEIDDTDEQRKEP